MRLSLDASLEPKEYTPLKIFKPQFQYEGEVDKAGYPSGNGIHFEEEENSFMILEGNFLGNGLIGLGRCFSYIKDT